MRQRERLGRRPAPAVGCGGSSAGGSGDSPGKAPERLRTRPRGAEGDLDAVHCDCPGTGEGPGSQRHVDTGVWSCDFLSRALSRRLGHRVSEVLAGDTGIHRVVGDLPEEAAVPPPSPGLRGALTPRPPHSLTMPSVDSVFIVDSCREVIFTLGRNSHFGK